MPLGSLIFFTLTTRSGSVIRCFSEATRSVPPARISVFPQESLNSAVASFNVLGAEYSNDFMLLLSAQAPQEHDLVSAAGLAHAHRRRSRLHWQWLRRAR